jgi:hypothetical protein
MKGEHPMPFGKKKASATQASFDMRVVVTGFEGVTSRFIAIAKIGGMNVRSEAHPDPVQAVQGLFQQLSQPHHGNAIIGIQMAIEGIDFEDTLRALESGQD